ncbi:ROK family transcriptional regulator [Ravibacter arvi]|uniref:ROK family transcriptional regulator n=1 Tax=Ravibacter arvi TaxID=2051041 RepID=A0ABP8LRU0_9BACT
MAEIIENSSSVIDLKKNRLRRHLIKELYRTHTTSINKLSRLFHSSIPSATGIVNEMQREGWVIEKGIGVAKAGRPPVLYGLNSDKKVNLLIDVNRNEANFVVMNLNNEILHEHHRSLHLENAPSYLAQLTGELDAFLAGIPLSREDFWGIGVTMPGLISPSQGLNQSYPQLTPEGVSLTEALRKKYQLPVLMMNDTHATAYGEYRFGLAKKFKHVLTINIDWGVGLGVLLEGEVFGGSKGFAGELGHIQVNPDGILCECGKVGCLDTITSAVALIRQAEEGIAAGRATLLTKLAGADNHSLSADHIIQAVKMGDSFSIDLLSNLGAELGKGLATAVHLFNPEAIIVTGVLARADNFITNPMEQAINRYCLSDFRNALTIKISELGPKARLLGCQANLVNYLAEKEFCD